MSEKPMNSISPDDKDEAPSLDEAFFDHARVRVGGKVVREATGSFSRRGRPPKGTARKVQQSLRLSPEVLSFFRETGDGWQTRIDDVLMEHVRSQVAAHFPRGSLTISALAISALDNGAAISRKPVFYGGGTDKPRVAEEGVGYIGPDDKAGASAALGKGRKRSSGSAGVEG